jgi:hypothetical protein
MDKVGLERTTPAGKLLLLACLAALAVGGAVLWAADSPPLRIAAVGMWLVTLGLTLVLRRGGIADGDDTAQQWQKYQEQLLLQRKGGGQAAPAPPQA